MMARVSERAPWVVAGLILGLLIGGAWNLGYFDLTSVPASGAPSTAHADVPPESGAVAVSSQKAGASVLIDSVTVPPPGVWVAVQDVNEDGSLGNVLGAARVKQPASAVVVALLRATLPGQRYAVVLYRDDGNGQFSLAGDSAYIDFDTGAKVVEFFKTTN
jgi:hypothetical protein